MTGPPPPTATAATVASKAAVLRRLELEVTRRLDGMLTGDYLAVAAGPGSERSWARKYEPGDDARQMDWNLSARSLLPHVRTTEADREMETWVVADRSASLDFGTAEREKREVVLAAAAAFGFLTARHGNRLGVSGRRRRQRQPPPRSKRPARPAGGPVETLLTDPRMNGCRPGRRSRSCSRLPSSGPRLEEVRSSWCPTSSTPRTGPYPSAASRFATRSSPATSPIPASSGCPQSAFSG